MVRNVSWNVTVSEAKIWSLILVYFIFLNTPVPVSVCRKKCYKVAAVVDSFKYTAQFLEI